MDVIDPDIVWELVICGGKLHGRTMEDVEDLFRFDDTLRESLLFLLTIFSCLPRVWAKHLIGYFAAFLPPRSLQSNSFLISTSCSKWYYFPQYCDKKCKKLFQETRKSVVSLTDLKVSSFRLSVHPKCQTFPSILHQHVKFVIVNRFPSISTIILNGLQSLHFISLSCSNLSERDKELTILTRQNCMNVELLWNVAQSALLHIMDWVILRLCVPGFRIRLSFWIRIGELARMALGNNSEHFTRLYLN
jgi:hypothetical protein